MIEERDRYMELDGLREYISDARDVILNNLDNDYLLESDIAILKTLGCDLEVALARFDSIFNKDMMKCQCGHAPKLNPCAMKVECSVCYMSGPQKASRAEAVEAWNRIVKGLEDGEE